MCSHGAGCLERPAATARQGPLHPDRRTIPDMISKPQRRRGAGVLGLISADHFFSHFYYLVLPPLFPLLTEVYGVGYTELGFGLMAMSLGNTLTAAPVGVLVDRVGARAPLIGGLALAGLCYVLIPLFPTFGALVVFMTLIGVANSVFHPANYVILDAIVPNAKVGRAFSVHSFGGYLGTAAAPATVIFLEAHSNWQTALVLSGAAGVIMAGVLLAFARHIPDVQRTSRRPGEESATRRPGAMQVMFSAPVLLGLMFFAVLAFAEIGISDFGVSSIHLVYAVPLTSATIALSAFLFAAPVGVLLGGWLADAYRRHDIVAALCMTVFAVCLAATALLNPTWSVLIVLFAVAGLASGLVAPSRDLMIRSVTPPGDMGKVFGFVSAGFNLGGLLAPPFFGYLLDHSDPRIVFVFAAVFGVFAALVALATGRTGARTKVAPAAG